MSADKPAHAEIDVRTAPDSALKPGWYSYTDELGRQRYRFVPLPFGMFAPEPPPPKPHELVCAFCQQVFRADRPHAKTCSGACRVMLHRALKKPAKVAQAMLAQDWGESYSEERKAATGWALLTAQEVRDLAMAARKRAGLDQDE